LYFSRKIPPKLYAPATPWQIEAQLRQGKVPSAFTRRMRAINALSAVTLMKIEDDFLSPFDVMDIHHVLDLQISQDAIIERLDNDELSYALMTGNLRPLWNIAPDNPLLLKGFTSGWINKFFTEPFDPLCVMLSMRCRVMLDLIDELGHSYNLIRKLGYGFIDFGDIPGEEPGDPGDYYPPEVDGPIEIPPPYIPPSDGDLLPGDPGYIPPSDGDLLPGDPGYIPPSDGEEGYVPPAPGDPGYVPGPGEEGYVPPAPGDPGYIPGPGEDGYVPPAPGDPGYIPPAPGDPGYVPGPGEDGYTDPGTTDNTNDGGGGSGSAPTPTTPDPTAIDGGTGSGSVPSGAVGDPCEDKDFPDISVTIGYTTQQMAVSETQDLSVYGRNTRWSSSNYVWKITGGGGTLDVKGSEPLQRIYGPEETEYVEGATLRAYVVEYTAPDTNPYCECNPIIELWCGGALMAILSIAVNAVEDVAYILNFEDCQAGEACPPYDASPGLSCICATYDYYGCDGAFLSHSSFDYPRQCGCQGTTEGFPCEPDCEPLDIRSDDAIQYGCCPVALL